MAYQFSKEVLGYSTQSHEVTQKFWYVPEPKVKHVQGKYDTYEITYSKVHSSRDRLRVFLIFVS